MKIISSLFIMVALLSMSTSLNGQQKWDARLVLSKLDCQDGLAWYTLELSSSTNEPWLLADQNYRFFFDGDLMNISTVRSLLPRSVYSEANVDQNLKIQDEGQESYSPLNDIDDHLGFLDFSIVNVNKVNPSAAVKITAGVFVPIAEIKMKVARANLQSMARQDALSLYFSRPSTAGKITNQYTVITELDAPSHTIPTSAGQYIDLLLNNGLDTQLAKYCRPGSGNPSTTPLGLLSRAELNELTRGQLVLFPNPTSNWIRYSIPELSSIGKHTVIIYDQFSREVRRVAVLGDQADSVNIGQLPDGMYTLVIRTDDAEWRKPFVKTGH